MAGGFLFYTGLSETRTRPQQLWYQEKLFSVIFKLKPEKTLRSENRFPALK